MHGKVIWMAIRKVVVNLLLLLLSLLLLIVLCFVYILVVIVKELKHCYCDRGRKRAYNSHVVVATFVMGKMRADVSYREKRKKKLRNQHRTHKHTQTQTHSKCKKCGSVKI